MKSLTKMQSRRQKRAGAGLVPSSNEIVNPRIVALSVDQRSIVTDAQRASYKRHVDAAVDAAVTPDNFEQVLAGVIADMNAGDVAPTGAPVPDQEDDSF